MSEEQEIINDTDHPEEYPQQPENQEKALLIQIPLESYTEMNLAEALEAVENLMVARRAKMRKVSSYSTWKIRSALNSISEALDTLYSVDDD